MAYEMYENRHRGKPLFLRAFLVYSGCFEGAWDVIWGLATISKKSAGFKLERDLVLLSSAFRSFLFKESLFLVYSFNIPLFLFSHCLFVHHMCSQSITTVRFIC